VNDRERGEGVKFALYIPQKDEKKKKLTTKAIFATEIGAA